MKALALFLALATVGHADVYNRAVSWTSKNGGSVGEAAALMMVRDYATGLWTPVSGTAGGGMVSALSVGGSPVSTTNPVPVGPPLSGALNISVSAGIGSLTWTTRCDAAKLYQSHIKITATTGTGTYVVASPTAAGKIIRVKALHLYNTQCTASGGAIVTSYAYGSFSGLTITTNPYFCPNAAPSSESFGQIDEDDAVWAPCGWPLAANDQIWWNLDNALTGGQWYIHAVWWEE